MSSELLKKIGLTVIALVGPPIVFLVSAMFLPWKWLEPTFIPWELLFLLAVVVGGYRLLARAWPRWAHPLMFLYVPLMLCVILVVGLYVGMLMGGETL